jgi:cytochrome c
MFLMNHGFNWILILVFVGFVFVGNILILTPASSVLADETLLERGQELFKKCVHCHTYAKRQGHRIGPNLYGMFGRKAGALSDYDYSEAWKTAKFIWTDQTLDTYLKAPHKMIPNNRMPFNGLSRPQDRRALITYMRTIVVPQ